MKNNEYLKWKYLSLVFSRRKFMPHEYHENINGINIGKLKKSGIKGIIFDIDQTLVNYHQSKIQRKIIDKFIELQDNFECTAVSNYTQGRSREQILGEKYGIKIIKSLKKKPDALPYILCMKEMNTSPSETAMVGNCHLTDLIGANMLGIYTIKVHPFMRKAPLWVRAVYYIEYLPYLFYKLLYSSNYRKVYKYQ